MIHSDLISAPHPPSLRSQVLTSEAFVSFRPFSLNKSGSSISLPEGSNWHKMKIKGKNCDLYSNKRKGKPSHCMLDKRIWGCCVYSVSKTESENSETP